jgi:hypothetical protein
LKAESRAEVVQSDVDLVERSVDGVVLRSQPVDVGITGKCRERAEQTDA